MQKLFWTDKRLDKVIRRLGRGYALQDIADKYQITRQAVHGALSKYRPDFDLRNCRRDAATEREKQVRLSRKNFYLETTGREGRIHPTEFSRRCSRMFTEKCRNARTQNWKWDIKITDVHFPTHCPILGVRLDYSGQHIKENSPSFDRVNPKRGYVKGNVVICSWRANRIKNDGTLDEHVKIAKFMRKHAKAKT